MPKLKASGYSLVHRTFGTVYPIETITLVTGEALVCQQGATIVKRTLLIEPQFWESPAVEVLGVFNTLRGAENERIAARKDREYAHDESVSAGRRTFRISAKGF